MSGICIVFLLLIVGIHSQGLEINTEYSWRLANIGELSPVNSTHEIIIEKMDKMKICDTEWEKSHEHPRPYWVWDDPNMDMFDSSKFCETISNKKGILFVGDSIQALFFRTLIASIGGEKVSTSGNDNKWVACNGVNFTLVWNGYLDHRVDQEWCQTPHETLCVPFASPDILKDYDVLIMNTGAHYRTDDVLIPNMESTASIVSDIMFELHDNPLLIYRNTVPGHKECNDNIFGKPIGGVLEAEEYVDSFGGKYHWNEFKHQNDKVFGIFGNYGFELMDVYTPTIMRSDSHLGGKDCLHYCIPGPADHWVRMLMNMFMVRA